MIYSHSESVHNLVSPSKIVPLVLDFVNPNSIIDIGCGIGTWLHVAKSLGIEKVLGIDGNYINKDLLKKYIRLDEYESADLSKPLDLARKFDLCFCLEVVEHLPKESSRIIVETLINHSDVILFSAAIPGQGGQNHLNEQNPSFWADIFAGYDFHFYDVIRPLIWGDPNIEFWYKQNIFIVAKKDFLKIPKSNQIDLLKVHPDLVTANSKELNRIVSINFQLKEELNFIKSGKKSLLYYLSLIIKYFIK